MYRKFSVFGKKVTSNENLKKRKNNERSLNIPQGRPSFNKCNAGHIEELQRNPLLNKQILHSIR